MSGRNRFGIEIASPEQQKKTALFILAVVLMIGGGTVLAFTGPALYAHFTYVPAKGLVTALEEKCHYVVKRLNKRGPANVTDLVDCTEAYRVAAEISHDMGEVRAVTLAHVDYELADGTPHSSWFDLPAEAARDLRIGQTIEIQYDPDNTHRIIRQAVRLFALTHEGRYGLTQETKPAEPGPTTPTVIAGPLLPGEPLTEPVDNRTTAQKIGSFIGRGLAYVVVFLVPYLTYRLVRGVWRRLRGRGSSPSPSRRPAPSSPPLARDSLAGATRPRSQRL